MEGQNLMPSGAGNTLGAANLVRRLTMPTLASVRPCAQCSREFRPIPSSAGRFCSAPCAKLYRKLHVIPLDVRFWAKVNKANDCWLWTGSKNRAGYGLINIQGKSKLAPRVAYELCLGPIPDGLLVCHRCDTPSCVNPDHLFLGTHADNMRDASAKNRICRVSGDLSPITRLSDAHVREIRRRAVAERLCDLAVEFGVSASHVCKIVKGKARPQTLDDRALGVLE